MPTTFGNTNVEVESVDYDNADMKHVMRAQLTEAGSVTKLSAYLGNTQTGHQACYVKGLIYNDKAGPLPDALLGTSAATALADNKAAGWTDLTFSTPVALAAGYYWIGIIFDELSAGVTWPRKLGGATFPRYFNADDYTDGPTNPFGSGSNTNVDWSIYATYSATSTGFTGLTVTRLLQG